MGAFAEMSGDVSHQVKSSQDLSPQMTRKPNTQNRAPLMCLSGQPARKVRLVASGKQDGNECAWVVNVAPTAAAVWAERTCEVAGRPEACSAQGSVAYGAMRPFSPGATSSWTGAASSLASSRPPPAPRVLVATSVITSRTTTSSTPSPLTPVTVFVLVHGRRTETPALGVSFSGEV